MILNSADLLLWSRCRRQWVQYCRPGGEGRRAPLPRDLISLANLREMARVTAAGCRLFGPDFPDLAPPGDTPAAVHVLSVCTGGAIYTDWNERTNQALARGEPFTSGLLLGAGIACTVDVARYHPRMKGWEFYLIRPGTGLRGSFETEGSILSGVCKACKIPVAAVHLLYLDKSKRRPGSESPGSWRELFLESNITGRAEKRWKAVERELTALREHLTGDTPIDEDYRCRQGCRLCAPPGDLEGGRYDVLTLHKGRHIGRELQVRGIYDLREVDPSNCRLTDRQMIQIETVRSGTAHVDRERLNRFLSTLKWPLSFLDFEAYSQSLPPMAGLAPYEHVPVIASLHRQAAPLEEPEALVFVAEPGRDQRVGLFDWLEENLGDEGTIVVFSKPFESAMARQLALAAGAPERGDAQVRRMVDLLVPFAEFMVYHPDQKGKVSLKQVLPIFTESGYDEVTVQDGMHANLTCMRRADQVVAGGEGIAAIGAGAAEAVSRLVGEEALPSLEDVARYCAMDTRAMVELVDTLYTLANGRASDD